jgi:predicted acyl esterase
VRRTLLLLVTVGVLAWPGIASAWTKQDVTIPASDGLPLAASLYVPAGAALTATAAGGWARLVAVLTARTPAGKEIIVSAGGLPTTPGKRTYTIRMIDQATFVPKGSRLSVTVASSSSAQNPANLLYLDLPMVAGARVTLGPIALSIPVLTKVISG